MRTIDFSRIIKKAWANYKNPRKIVSIYDVSPQVSTNHVFEVSLDDGQKVYAKLSYYGKFEHFKEDHTIINILAKKLLPPYEHFLAHSLTKNGEVFTYRFHDRAASLSAWVVFYQSVKIDQRLPRRLEEKHIQSLGRELALFHQACEAVQDELPHSSKTLSTDMEDLATRLETEIGQFEFWGHADLIRRQCSVFLNHLQKINYRKFRHIPVFLDWNIGNFSVTEDTRFFSRWDYDWFRMGSPVLDFYFFSRVVSTIGDRTVFSYLIDSLMEDRFMLFLQSYHSINPLSEAEVRFLPEAYRFFILNYVIKDGRYFFHEIYANRLRREAYELYLPSISSRFDAEKVLRVLKM
ncbi:MAG: hypothetical protein NW226_17945 [Microscillaceae bacterium]|nr:hypothetical protein [Microscillaceae bacterium]